MIQFSKGSRRGWAGTNIWQTPPAVSKTQLSCVSTSLPQTSNTLTFGKEKIPHLIPFCKDFTCKKIWKKIPFPGRRQHMEQEPGKLLLIHAKLHSQHRTVFLSVFHPYSHCTYFTFTHTEHIHTHPPSFQIICTLSVPNIQLIHTLHPQKHPHFMYNFRVQPLFLNVLYPFLLMAHPIMS